MSESKTPIMIILIIGVLLFISISNLNSIDYTVIQEGNLQRNIRVVINIIILLIPLVFFGFALPKELKNKKVIDKIKLLIFTPIAYLIYIIVSSGVIISPLCSFVDSYTISKINTSSSYNELVISKKAYNNHGQKYSIEIFSRDINKNINLNCDSTIYSKTKIGDSLLVKYYYSSNNDILISKKRITF